MEYWLADITDEKGDSGHLPIGPRSQFTRIWTQQEIRFRWVLEELRYRC